MSSHTRAKAKRATRDETEARLDHVCGLMRSGKYERGVTDKSLAVEWGVAVATVQGYTSEASKRIAKEVRDPDAVDADIGAFLRWAIQAARKSGRPREGIEAAKVWATLAGRNAPDRHEHSGPNGGPIDVRAAQDEILGSLARVAAGGKTDPSDPKPDG